MSLHRQPCPSCGRELELPADAIGRMAKCPACETTFRIGETGGDQAGASLDPVPPTPPVPSEPPIPSEPPESARSENPFQAPIASSSETTGSASGRPVNPYQATSYSADPVLRLGDTEIVQRPIEDIVSPTLAIFGARWSPLILAALILLVATGMIFGVPFLLLSVIGSMIDNGALPNGGPVLAIAALLFFPFIAFLSCYTTVGFARVSLAVARNQPSPLSQLMPPLVIVFRFAVGLVALLFGLALISLVVVVIIALVGSIQGGEAIAAGLAILAMIMATVFVFAAQWLLWPWIFVVSDGKTSALASLRVGYNITMSNKVTSLLVVIISTVLSMAGSAACYVGQFVTTPLTMLMFAVGYLLLTNQAIDNPKDSMAPYVPPSYPPQQN
ncbi:hypothetical protein SH528x_001015 [Novipirellula sp. SH528]|uniref:hypothetical protein n=1 Tax=Novipirellula sp. SH528 TaxID=3454466 RepID=UPI003F9F0F69